VVYGLVTFIAAVLAGGVLEAIGYAKYVRNVRVSGDAHAKKEYRLWQMKKRKVLSPSCLVGEVPVAATSGSRKYPMLMPTKRKA